MQKIWICGANGQIGKELNQVVDKLKYEIFNTDVDILDITDIDEVLSFGEVNRPDIIINCAGLTDVKACEKDEKMAYKVNALGARNMAIIARKLESKLVHISTDDVFDGESRESYREYDSTNPQTTYGKSKLQGENYVKEFTAKHFIIRSNWVYGYGENFVKYVLDKAEKKEEIKVSDNHFGSPTSAEELARFILKLIETSEYGVYHATNKGVCNRMDFAKKILEYSNIEGKVKAVTKENAEFSTVRPANSVLDNFILSLIDVYEFPSWEESLKKYIENKGRK